MDIISILKLPLNKINTKENLKILSKAYKDEFNENVCMSCGGEILNMISSLKKHYNMSQFRLKNNKYFRISKDSSKTINNNIITDELALEFLEVDKDRIKYFEKYPENWEELLQSDEVEETDFIDGEFHRSELMKFKMQELREQFPDVKAVSKEEFVNEVIVRIKNNEIKL